MHLTARQEELGLLALGAVGLSIGAVALWPGSRRHRVATAAYSRQGSKNAAEFWKDVLPGLPPTQYPRDWCGAFALWCLHQAGLAKDTHWLIGTGFLFKLPTVKIPDVGDVAYFDTNQHQAVVVGYDAITDRVALMNGNGSGGAVTPSVHARSAAQAYYSIEPFVQKANAAAILPWAAVSAAVASAAAWYLIPSR